MATEDANAALKARLVDLASRAGLDVDAFVEKHVRRLAEADAELERGVPVFPRRSGARVLTVQEVDRLADEQRGTSPGQRKPPMTTDALLKRISVDPEVCHGQPCIRGHRIWVSLVLDLLAGGLTVDQVLAQYPGLEAEDIRACFAYASEMTRTRIVGRLPGR